MTSAADSTPDAQPTASAPLHAEIEREVGRRRTFAIISHPDAGKTTLTEKLLLYAGAIELAGAVRGRAGRRAATSDWMEMEQQRGISITSAALEFEIQGRRMSLIDTPGHNDFSEDTYRALIAADGVVMVIDAANGVETQTRKLFEVCRRHRLPILTFINKFDRPTRDPLELIDDLERTLGIAAAPVNWPVGSGERFRGVYDLRAQTLLRYEREAQGMFRAPVDLSAIDDPEAVEIIGPEVYSHFREELQVVREAGTTFDLNEYLAGRQTPVFFGSALTNFGLEPFLQALVEFAPCPGPRQADTGVVLATDERFAGFVFKIQANMDPRHRDRIAFVRVCAGRFVKDMALVNSRQKKTLRASRAYRFFGRERETIEVAYAGDIIGLVNPGQLGIGDTLHAVGPAMRFPDLPRFPAEHFGRARLRDTRYKQFDDGLQQLEEEGLMQVFYTAAGRREPIIGVVGSLQYDVIKSRLNSEYGVAADIDPLNYTCARWVEGSLAARPGGSSMVASDRFERPVILFESEWELNYFQRHHEGIVLHAESPVMTGKPPRG